MNSRRRRSFIQCCKIVVLFVVTFHVTNIFLKQYVKTDASRRWMQDIAESYDAGVYQNFSVAEFYNEHFKLERSTGKKRRLESDFWQEVIPSSQGRLFVYSAYYDGRLKEPLVRVMAVGFRNRTKTVYCGLYSKNLTFVGQTKAALKKLPEHHDYNYAGIQLLCSMPSDFQSVPDWVTISEESLTLNNTAVAATLLPVHHNQSGSNNKSFAVCVKPMHSGYDRALWLVEFFEMHRVLGVEHFYMYVDQIGPNVRKVLQSYKRSGVVTELVWTLDLKSKVEIHTEGIMVSLNDCLYRTMNRYNYTIMVDLDEFIIPAIPNVTYSQVIAPLQLNDTGCFIFQNFFFFLYWNNDTKVLNQFNESLSHSSVDNFNTTSLTLTDLPYLLTIFKTRRLKKPHHFGDRSKFIVRPEAAVVVGNHFIHQYTRGYKTVKVTNTIASTHHYRQICTDKDGYECIGHPSTIDRSAWSYSAKLIPRIFQECEAAFPETKMCPVAPPLQGPPY